MGKLIKKACIFLQVHGWKKTLKKIKAKISERLGAPSYDKFLKKNRLTETVRKEQRKKVFNRNIKFSIVVLPQKAAGEYLAQLKDSVERQTYGNWELCCARESNNPNDALAMATGDYILLAGREDVLTEDALFACAEVLDRDPTVDVIYSDEDKVDASGQQYFDPAFKPDYNIDLLCSENFIGHLFVFSRELYQKCGGFQREYEGAQEYDLILRYTEQADRIYHIPRVLYHRRSLNTADGGIEQYEAGRRAAENHYRRLGIPARVEPGDHGTYHTVYGWEEQPLVSIIVPNKDYAADLRKCMDSVDSRSTYRNYEWIIVENNSREQETFAYYKEIEKRENVKVIRYEGDFNFSKINNYAVAFARGEYLLLLNNDTEMISGNALEEMLHLCMREDVGIVGAQLYYQDSTIQHAGVVIGLGGIAGHTFLGQPMGAAGYMSRILCTQAYSAVTAACLMIQKEVYEQVGGLTEDFKVTLNDIDFCLKVRALGKWVVYNPYAQFFHYESKSRGLEDTPEKLARYKAEVRMFRERWGKIYKEGDPFYNPNLSLERFDFELDV